MNASQFTSAGAPALAEGLFYRLVSQPYSMYKVEIRRLRPYYGSTRVATAQSFPHETIEAVAAVAARAAERV